MAHDATKNPGLSADTLKIIAIVCMTIDHVAWAFVPRLSPLGQAMHIIGRITAPTMCFFIAEGYHYTRSLQRYAGRLALFALFSEVPFTLFEYGKPFVWGQCSVIYTLFLSLLAVAAYDRIRNIALRVAAIFILCCFATLGDWSFWAILFCLIFHVGRGSFFKQASGMITLTILMQLGYIQNYLRVGYTLADTWPNTAMQMGVVLSLPLLYFYRGRRGNARWGKWLFYVYYPAHLLALFAIKAYMGMY